MTSSKRLEFQVPARVGVQHGMPAERPWAMRMLSIAGAAIDQPRCVCSLKKMTGPRLTSAGEPAEGQTRFI